MPRPEGPNLTSSEDGEQEEQVGTDNPTEGEEISESGIDSEITAVCVNCRQTKIMKDPKIVRSRHRNTPNFKGDCPDCHSHIYRVLNKEEEEKFKSLIPKPYLR